MNALRFACPCAALGAVLVSTGCATSLSLDRGVSSATDADAVGLVDRGAVPSPPDGLVSPDDVVPLSDAAPPAGAANDEADRAAAAAPGPRSRVTFGAQSGVASPLGYGALLAGVQSRYGFGVELGAGTGGGLGWAASQSLLSRWGSAPIAFGFRAGVAEKFLAGSVRAAVPSAPAVAWALPMDTFVDIGSGPVVIRPAVGLMVHHDTWSASAPITFYATTDLLWAFDVGSPAPAR